MGDSPPLTIRKNHKIGVILTTIKTTHRHGGRLRSRAVSFGEDLQISDALRANQHPQSRIQGDRDPIGTAAHEVLV